MNLLKGFSLGKDEWTIIINIVFGLVSGFIIMGGYIFGHKNKKYSKNFAITLLLLPAIMTVVIPYIATDLKKAVSLAGIFALVRFRSIPGDSKDILYVFFTLAVGIILGLNSYVIGFILTIVISVLFVIMQRYWVVKTYQILRITLPEDLNYNGAFDDIFKKYTVKSSFSSVKTSNMGSLFTVSYNIQLKPNADVKSFIDELRTRNGNLNIVLCDSDELQTSVL